MKKKRCEHLEAFAMLGALAWQATTVIKMVLVSGGRSHGDFSVSAPGSPPTVSWCAPLSAPLVRSDLPGTTFYRRESIKELPTKDQRYNR